MHLLGAAPSPCTSSQIERLEAREGQAVGLTGPAAEHLDRVRAAVGEHHPAAGLDGGLGCAAGAEENAGADGVRRVELSDQHDPHGMHQADPHGMHEAGMHGAPQVTVHTGPDAISAPMVTHLPTEQKMTDDLAFLKGLEAG